MTIFAQTFKSVDSQISDLEQQLQQLQDYRQRLQTADETTESSLKAISESLKELDSEHIDEVKREITRYLGLDSLPAQPTTDSTSSNGSSGREPESTGNDFNSSDNRASGESKGAECNGNDRTPSSNGNENGTSAKSEATESTTSDSEPVSIFTPVGADSTDRAPNSSENGKSEQSEAATDSASNESTASASESSECREYSQFKASKASGEDEVVRHEHFPDEYIQIEDSNHHYNGRVCLIKKLVKKGYYCVLESRTDEEGSEKEELLLYPSQVKGYKLPTQQEAESIGSGVFPEFSVNQRVWVRQNGAQFSKQGTITKLNSDVTGRVKLDNYPNSISVAFKDMQAAKKSTEAPSSG